MSKLVSSESVRFTPAQRDALIDMAGRLQAEHEATITSDELARAAAEAGIDPRFLGEAALRLEANPSPAVTPVDLRMLLGAMIGLVVVNLWFLMSRPIYGYGAIIGQRDLIMLAVSSFCLATIAARQKPVRWVAPLGVIAVWLTLTIGYFFLSRFSPYSRQWVFPTALAACIVQAIAAALAVGFATLQDGPRRR